MDQSFELDTSVVSTKQPDTPQDHSDLSRSNSNLSTSCLHKLNSTPKTIKVPYRRKVAKSNTDTSFIIANEKENKNSVSFEDLQQNLSQEGKSGENSDNIDLKSNDLPVRRRIVVPFSRKKASTSNVDTTHVVPDPTFDDPKETGTVTSTEKSLATPNEESFQSYEQTRSTAAPSNVLPPSGGIPKPGDILVMPITGQKFKVS